MKYTGIIWILVSTLFVCCGRRPGSSGQSNAEFTNVSHSYGYSSLTIDVVYFENIGAMSNFPAVVKKVEINLPTNCVVVFQKSVGYDNRTIFIVETNLANPNLALLTNLVIGETYVLPECVSPNGNEGSLKRN